MIKENDIVLSCFRKEKPTLRYRLKTLPYRLGLKACPRVLLLHGRDRNGLVCR